MEDGGQKVGDLLPSPHSGPSTIGHQPSTINHQPSAPYPRQASERDRWIVEQRPERNRLDPWRPYAFLVESELGADGVAVAVATLFLTNRECPYRCLMCDLWRNTLDERVPVGAIPTPLAAYTSVPVAV